MSVVKAAREIQNIRARDVLILKHRELFANAAKHFKIKKLSDWYGAPIAEVKKYPKVSTALKHYSFSLPKALVEIYPEYPWEIHKFHIPKGHWDDIANQRFFFNQIAAQLNIQNLDDWYSVSTTDVRKHGGSTLLSLYYGSSLFKALKAVYPHHNWKPWLFLASPRRSLQTIEVQKQLFQSVANELNITKLDDWYKVPRTKIKGCKGVSSVLATYYNNSLVDALKAIYPEHDWQWSNFSSKKPSRFWHSVDNQLQLLNTIGKELNVRKPADWLNVRGIDLRKLRGSSLLEQHGWSFRKVLEEVYPNIDWQTLRRNRKKNFTNEALAPKERFLQSLGDGFVPQNLDHILKTYGSQTTGLTNALASTAILAKKTQSFRTVSKAQLVLFKVVKLLFPTCASHINHLMTDVHYHKSRSLEIELDVFLPELSLALEYQGYLHYSSTQLWGDHRIMKARDENKRQLVTQYGVTLIDVPYWWDETPGSLAATINACRPDIQMTAVTHTDPIPPERINTLNTSVAHTVSFQTAVHWYE